LLDKFALVAVLAGLLIVLGGARAAETRLTDLLLEQTAARAADQVRIGLMPRVTADDFAPPYEPQKLTGLERRLEPFVARMREQGSGLIRLQIHGPDGTVLYSDDPSWLGQVVPPATVPLMPDALAGSVGAEFSALTDPDDADLRAQYDGALKVQVPLVVDGQVVGVFQLYQDSAALHQLQSLLWGAVAGMLTLLGLAGYLAGRLARRGPVPAVSPSPTSPVVAAAAEAALTPREREVLALMAANCTYKEIAVQLVLSEGTVRTHAKNILRKLQQPDRAQAVIAAVRTGLLHVS
jgi:DNA-binding CsgD family transcriptional regulator